ncbi:MAG: wax ester/triacylglycerol synthase family O-acyltransferase, partial [Propionibacteriaceae bacterium]|nr:wax ester/triacylglycerol synthase family O-acyltransferase [Propionibacteriaceae bacterium]
MPTRLTAREMSMLALDTQHTPAHTSAVDIFSAPDDFEVDRLVAVINERLAYVPRYRMRLLPVPGALAAPVWVEDEDFDLSYHVRRSALPRGGTPEQLREFVGRVCARRLDRSRPLWEVYLVEGLAENRFAVVTKTHQLLVDGLDGVDLGQVLLDEQPTDGEPQLGDPWEPAPEPRPIDLVVDAVRQSLTDRDALFDAARRGVTGVLGTAVAVGEAVGGLGGALGEFAGAALRGGIRPRNDTPLAGTPSEQRRVAQVSMPLADLRALRMNERYTVNDVVLALISGALRDWLATRGEPSPTGGILAMVPMSVIDEDGEPTSLGSHVAPHLIQLPVDEANALMRLHQVSFGTRAHTDTGRAVSARTISDIAGFAPSTLHALGVRVATTMSRRPHDLLITNAPGPQRPMYAAGAPMVASYPVLPLPPGHLLAIGVTSYNGHVYFGLTGDRDSMSDLDVLAQCLADARLELLETAARAEASRQPTRAADKRPTPEKTSPPAPKQPAVQKRTPARKRSAQKTAGVTPTPTP